MKKLFTFIIVLSFILIGCGSKDGEGSKNKESGKSEKSDGIAFENNFFKATIPSGWEVWDDKADEMGLMRIRIKGDTGMKEAIYLKFEGKKGMSKLECANNPVDMAKSMAKNQKGSPPVTTTYNGITFYKTTYNYGGKQTYMIGKKDGTCITITLAGGDISNPKIEDILKTIIFK